MLNTIAERTSDFYQYLQWEFGVEAVLGNLDTITIFCYRLPREIRQLEYLMGTNKWWIEQTYWGYRIILQQPNPDTLEWLGEKQASLETGHELYRLKVSGLHVGLEFVTDKQVKLQDHLRDYLSLKRQRKLGKNRYLGTDYWDPRKDANRNLAVYSGKLSRHPGFTDRTCCRLELRLRRRAIITNGLTEIREIHTEDIIDRLAKNVRCVDEAVLEEKVRRQVSQRLSTPHSLTGRDIIDRWHERSYLSERLSGYYLRYGVNHTREWDWTQLKGVGIDIVRELETEVEISTLNYTEPGFLAYGM